MNSRRRTTLGVLGASALNMRRASSIGGSSVPGAKSRHSLGSRRSSVALRTGVGSGPDPRPLGQKAFQQRCIRQLIEFLTTHQYDREISPSILRAPSRKDFVHILTFLLRHVDPHFDFGPAWAEDVPVFFEALGYPFRISKRSLLSVGSPHTWPALLAALAWLIDLLTYKECVELREQQQANVELSDSSQGAAGDRTFYGYLATVYSKWLEGADNFSYFEEDLANQFSHRNTASQEHIDAMRGENHSIRQEIETLEAAKVILPELQKKKNSLQENINKFEKLLVELEQYGTSLRSQLDDKDIESKHMMSELETTRASISELQVQFEEQELSAGDVHRMNQDKERLLGALQRFAKQYDELKQREWDLDVEYRQCREHSEAKVHAYNQLAASIGLLPSSAKYAHGIDYELKLRADEELNLDQSIEHAVSADLKGMIKPALMKLRQSFGKEIRNLQAEKRRILQLSSNSNDLRSQKSEEAATLQSRLDKLETMYREERDRMNAQLRESFSAVEDIELELHRLQLAGNDALIASQRDVEQADAQMQQLKETIASEQHAIHSEVCEVMELVTTHKFHVADTIKRVDEIVVEAFTSVEQTAV